MGIPVLPVMLFLSIGAISLFSFVSVAAWLDSRRKERIAYYRSETLKKISDDVLSHEILTTVADLPKNPT